MNPKPLSDEQTVLAQVHEWIRNTAINGRPDEYAIFVQKWSELEPGDHRILKALIEEGGEKAKNRASGKGLWRMDSIRRPHRRFFALDGQS